MIKPASAACNLRCRYCFYADISENRTIPVNGMMTEETTEVITQRIAEALENKGTANISFQGGEPTLAGTGYFRHFVSCMQKYPDIRVNYALPAFSKTGSVYQSRSGLCSRFALMVKGLVWMKCSLSATSLV